MKASLIKTLALTSGFACLTAFTVGPAMAGDKDIAQTGKTRAEVRAEYLQAVREGTLPNTTEMDETSYRALTARGHAIKDGKAMAKASESGASPLTREAVRADTVEWMRLHRGDVQMGGQ